MISSLMSIALWIAVLANPAGDIKTDCVTPDDILESIQEMNPKIERFTTLSGEDARAIAEGFQISFADKVHLVDIAYYPENDVGVVQLFDSEGCNLMSNGKRASKLEEWTGAFIGSFGRWVKRYLREV